MQKKLTKSSNKMVSGCLAGVAEYLGWDATLVRIGYAALSIFTFGLGGVVMYIVMCAVMPNE